MSRSSRLESETVRPGPPETCRTPLAETPPHSSRPSSRVPLGRRNRSTRMNGDVTARYPAARITTIKLCSTCNLGKLPKNWQERQPNFPQMVEYNSDLAQSCHVSSGHLSLSTERFWCSFAPGRAFQAASARRRVWPLEGCGGTVRGCRTSGLVVINLN